MSCPFLDKLPPETRALIYEYALFSVNPLKHVTSLQPFVKKLTGVGITSDSQSTTSEIEAAVTSESSDVDDSLQPVNTSLLTTSKLIYTEAIAVFYQNNLIYFDAQLLQAGKINFPLATDLYLATQIYTEIDLEWDHVAEGDQGFQKALAEVMAMASHGIPAIFPNLWVGAVYTYTDSVAHFTTTVRLLRRMHIGDALKFDGVGSATFVVGSLMVMLQSRDAIERWKDSSEPTLQGPIDLSGLWDYISAGRLHRESRADPQNEFAQLAQMLVKAYNKRLALPSDEIPEHDGYEYWTIVDFCLSALQKDARQADNA